MSVEQPGGRETRRLTLSVVLSFVAILATPPFIQFAAGEDDMSETSLREGFENPPMDCRPHTRWWWMGSAVTKEEISWELEEMKSKGIGGVEQISMSPVYEKGNIEFLSDEYLETIAHTVREAKRLGMSVSLNFGGPGWVIGGAWLSPEERSKCMVVTHVDLSGPSSFSGQLPTELQSLGEPHWEIRTPDIQESDPLIAVVAGKIVEGRIEESSLTTLTAQVNGQRLDWEVPEGSWRLMAFWLKPTGQGNAVDHFSKEAMTRYCEYLGGKFKEAVGEEFGKTVESMFCDSFEVALAPGGIYWSDRLMDEFRKIKGYDLTPYLPAVWWDIGKLTPKIRYDVNHFLHLVGLDAFFSTFLDWCEKNGVKGRIQPYGFATDIIQGAGMTHIPEMEVTAGEKDAVPWFDTRIGPKKLVSSGAHLYGRNVITTEAYTYIHWEPYRATLEELKTATDLYFRTGCNKIYNHGYSYSPERDISPGRGFYAAIGISHPNVWWKYYPLLSKYVARCCYLLRQGRPAADVALYHPLANQWTLKTLNVRRWTRDFDWGELGNLLVANGYDFDLVNDDVLQNHATNRDGKILVRDQEYSLFILPNTKALPLETMEFIQEYIRKGGVVVALETVPESSVGLADWEEKDAKVRSISQEMFREPQGMNGTGPHSYGEGQTYWIKKVIDRSNVLDRRRSALDPFLKTLRKHLPPDFGIDFALEGMRENKGLTFVHRKLDSGDLYFVTNVQDIPSTIPVTFRVTDATPWKWDPYTGKVSRLYEYRAVAGGIEIPLRLAPYESAFVLFEPGTAFPHVEESRFTEILDISEEGIVALAGENGDYRVTIATEDGRADKVVPVQGLPAPYIVEGDWKLVLEGRGFPKLEKTVPQLVSWTSDPDMKFFSGTGRYEIEFSLPEDYFNEDLQLLLDLGKVGSIAEAVINGATVGTRWMRGQMLDITDALREGENGMTVLVTNTLINRVSNLKETTPVPEEVKEHYGNGLGGPQAGLQEVKGFEPLPASGLMGPVRIVARKRVRLGF